MANYDFYPYVSLESNVDINDLRYSLRVYDPVKNINYLDQSNSKISPYSKNLLIKSTNNFRTHILKIVVNDPAKLKECILNTEELSKLFKFKSKDLKSLYDFVKLTNKIINDAKSQKYYNIIQDAYFDVKFTDLEYEHVFSIKKLNSEFNDVKKLNSEFLTKIFNYRKDHTIYFGK